MIIKFRSSVQRELDRFVREVSKADFSVLEVTKGAFTQARAKLNPWAFKRLNEVACNTFYEDAPFLTWRQMRMYSVDGTRLVLPKHPTIEEEFCSNYYGPKADSKQSMALASILYDPLNQLCIDSEIEGLEKVSEIDLLLRHLPHIEQGGLLVLDRFYPSKWLFFLLTAKKIEFCVRMKKDWWKVVEQFTNSDLTDAIVSFTLPKKDYDKLSEYPEIIDTEIQCRLVKVVLDTGEIEILCTSLLDKEKYIFAEFGDMYHLRWDEEEAYKRHKKPKRQYHMNYKPL